MFNGMFHTMFLDDIIDSSSIFYGFRSILYDHIRCFTSGMYVDIAISENCLDNPCGMSVYLLDFIESTFGDISREDRYLLDTDDTRIGYDKEIELVVDPVDEDIGKKCYPIETNPTPVESTSSEFYNRILIYKQDSWGCKKS